MRKLSPDFRKKTNESLCFAKHKQKHGILLNGKILSLFMKQSVTNKGNLELLQANLIITLSLGSIETDHVINEPCYNEVTYNIYI